MNVPRISFFRSFQPEIYLFLLLYRLLNHNLLDSSRTLSMLKVEMEFFKTTVILLSERLKNSQTCLFIFVPTSFKDTLDRERVW